MAGWSGETRQPNQNQNNIHKPTKIIRKLTKTKEQLTSSSLLASLSLVADPGNQDNPQIHQAGVGKLDGHPGPDS